ncbi:hypothetical protein M407DRAFT_241463 [Tulasnella calospora MUT 4182]|uniref:Ubiquitin-like domain-containing protein n=1 Tax=Tulasnella calospora MUT 4182 TaxID=1051891 RepID=A0A0C3QTB9_9AGAM|nr:hypothetical protein M407DRAFT_241463 [Tulasnella calospora MUT 4182]
MSDTEEVDKKPDVKPEKLTITVRASDGAVTKFMLKPTAKFEKVFAAFENAKGAAPGTYRFLSSEGVIIRSQETVGDYNWDEDEEISAVLAQQGGAFIS